MSVDGCHDREKTVEQENKNRYRRRGGGMEKKKKEIEEKVWLKKEIQYSAKAKTEKERNWKLEHY